MIARVTLARSAVDPAWVAELTEAVAAVGDARVVLIESTAPAFCLGGDLGHFAAVDDLPDELERMISAYHDALHTLATLPVPVVCAAHGGIGGGGLGLLWCADLVLLADDARLATGFSHLGLSGDGGSSWYLPRLVGLRRAAELTLEGRVLSAAEAVDWGLANRVVARDDLAAEAWAVARRLADGPSVAFGQMRRLLRDGLTATLRDGLDAETRAIAAAGATADAREGIAAFVARRRPVFEGR